MRFQKLSISASETVNGKPCRQTVTGEGGPSVVRVSYRKHTPHPVPSFCVVMTPTAAAPAEPRFKPLAWPHIKTSTTATFIICKTSHRQQSRLLNECDSISVLRGIYMNSILSFIQSPGSCICAADTAAYACEPPSLAYEDPCSSQPLVSHIAGKEETRARRAGMPRGQVNLNSSLKNLYSCT